VRTAQRLREKGCRVVTLDLTAIGQNLTPTQWYLGLLLRLGWQLNLEDPLEQFWRQHEGLGPAQRFFRALREVVLPTTSNGSVATRKLVIFVDELDVVRSLPFSTDEFFSAIREKYNRRAEDATLDDLTCCLLGVATPSELIQDNRITPFNIGRRIELEDFAFADVTPLSRGLGRDANAAAELMARIYYWTSGHPFLTQTLCQGVVSDGRVQTAAALDDLCAALFFTSKAAESNDNLLFVRERLLRSNERHEALQLFARVRAGETVPADESDPCFHTLRLAGIIRVVDGALHVRNRIYEQVFDPAWISHTMARNS
jgi:hypothetical protein